MGQSTSAIESVPTVYRVVLTTIEPLFATLGALGAFTSPAPYIAAMTRHLGVFDPASQFVFTQLGGGWLYFAFNEAVTLRLCDDLRIWKILSIGMLLSDIAYCHSTAQAVGGWSSYLNLSLWTTEDWLVLVTTMPMVTIRVLILLGVGLKKSSKNSGKDSKKQ
ncbi:uncharacterized protein V1516DRAFT_100661 [Lipomyces oligophaga]|uniref:uncharacterized protein n=1 Tax=Lipomyces oligophaga TaxID=45792 RepID=UPI0034CFA236